MVIDIIVSILAVLIVVSIILVPILIKRANKKKGIIVAPQCAACSTSKSKKTNLKMKYDKKHNSNKHKN